MQDNVREQLAAVQHDIWAHWTRYQFGACQRNEDGSITIPADKVERWSRQMETPYSELTDKECESDREQADKIILAIRWRLEAATLADVYGKRAEEAERKLNDVLPQYVAQMADAIKRAEAAESALRLATHSTGSTTVLMTLEQYQELLAADKRAEAAERERDAWKQEADDERKSMRSAVRVMQERAEAAEAQLALVDAYGQYMRNAPKPRTFAEWLEWRESVRA